MSTWFPCQCLNLCIYHIMFSLCLVLDPHIVPPTIYLLPYLLFSLVCCLVFDIRSLPHLCSDVSIFSFLPSSVASLLLPMVCEGLTPSGNLSYPPPLLSPPYYSIPPFLC